MRGRKAAKGSAYISKGALRQPKGGKRAKVEAHRADGRREGTDRAGFQKSVGSL